VSEGGDRRRLPERLVRAALRRPGRTFAVWGALALLVSPGVLALRIDTSTDSVLETTDRLWQFYQESQEAFGGDELIVVALEAESPLDPAALETIRTLTAALERIDGVRRVDSIATVPLIRSTPDGAMDLRAALARGVPDSDEAVQALRTELAADRIAPRAFVSEDGRVLSANVVLERADRLVFEHVVGSVRAATRGLPVWISGVPVFRTETNVWTRTEVATFVPLTVLVVGALLYLAFGSIRAVVIPLGTSAFGAWFVVAALGLTGSPLNVFTMILPSVMLALGCAYVMHLLTASGERDADTSLEAALVEPALPIALSGLTTAIGFVAISAVRIDAVRSVGGYGALGVLVVLAATLSLAPAALRMWPLPDRRSGLVDRIQGWLRPRLLEWIDRREAVIKFAWAAGVAVFALGVARLDVVTDVTVWFPHGTPVRDDYESIRQRLSGISPMNVVISAGAGRTVDTPEALAAIDGLTAHLATLPAVGKALSYADPVRQLYSGFQGEREAGLPATRAEIAQLLLLLESVEQLEDLVTDDRSGANVLLRVDDNGSTSLLEVADAAESWWARHGPPGLEARSTGIMFEFARAEHEIAIGQLRGLAFALAAIAAVLWAVFRRPGRALKALLPNAIPVVLVFGFMGFAGIPLDAGTVLVGSLALGIAVDDAVHLVSVYHAHEAAGDPPKAVLDRTFERVLPAVVLTSLVVAGGFSALVLSQFTFIRHLGALTAGVMALCLLANVTLLPVLLTGGRRTARARS
jgi:predicted RND superfamily exporter protein